MKELPPLEINNVLLEAAKKELPSFRGKKIIKNIKEIIM